MINVLFVSSDDKDTAMAAMPNIAINDDTRIDNILVCLDKLGCVAESNVASA